jgi:hypothetical protein
MARLRGVLRHRLLAVPSSIALVLEAQTSLSTIFTRIRVGFGFSAVVVRESVLIHFNASIDPNPSVRKCSHDAPNDFDCLGVSVIVHLTRSLRVCKLFFERRFGVV